MAGRYKICNTILLLSTIFQVGRPQDTFDSISQHFCLNLSGEDDNLSCPSANVEVGDCFDILLLCDGTDDCDDGADEGVTFASLECKYETSLIPLVLHVHAGPTTK